MSRSSKKAPYCEPRLLERVRAQQEEQNKKVIKTFSRASTIYPEFVGQTISVYNGKKHVPVYCTAEMVGFKLGEFVVTRNFKAHPKGTKKAPAPGKKG